MQATKTDIYDYDRILASRLALLQNDRNILQSNKQGIIDFDLYLASEVGIARRVKYIWNLTEIARMLGEKQFIDCTERDVREIVRKIESNPNWGVWTRHGFKTALKRFFRWLRQYPRNEDPPETKWIRLKRPKGRKLPEELLTQEEIKSLVEVCNENIRDKAFILTLYESGCRPGEILGLKRRNVIFDVHGAILIVDGKTGSRRVRIVAARPLLANWMNDNHPFKEDPDAYLWVNLEGRNYGKGLQYHAARQIIKKRCEQAKLNKRIYHYIFRHTRATDVAKLPSFNEALMDQFFGWVQGSRMPGTYVHLSGKDTDSPILEAYGIKPKESKELEKLKPKECHTCKTINSPINEFCISCGTPLDLEVALKIDEEKHKDAMKIDGLRRDLQSFVDASRKDKEEMKRNFEQLEEWVSFALGGPTLVIDGNRLYRKYPGMKELEPLDDPAEQ